MANPFHLNTRQKASAPDLHPQLAPCTNYDKSMGVDLCLLSLYGKDAPRDLFTTSSASPKTSSLTDAHSLKQETDSTYLARERTDSEKAVNGSQTDGRVMSQQETVTGLAGHITNDSSDELDRRGEEAEAIINGTDRAFGGYFGSHFDKEVSKDLGLWPLTASNREEAQAMVEGLERAHGNRARQKYTYSTDTVGRSNTDHSLKASNRECCMYLFQRHFGERKISRHHQRSGECMYSWRHTLHETGTSISTI